MPERTSEDDLARPRMVVVAGPPGSGKSTILPVAGFGEDCFNADDRAASLNGGSYHRIGPELRRRVSRELEEWISQHISDRSSFAVETTLRSTITFQQARSARERGFWTTMHYVCAGGAAESVKRIKQRSYRGGHSASERLVREIYEKSMRNLLVAFDFEQSAIDLLHVHDNSSFNGTAREVMVMRRGAVIRASDEIPPWLAEVLARRK